MALNKLLADSSKQLDIIARKGSTFDRNLSAVDVNAVAFVFTSYTATAKVYNPYNLTTEIINISVVLTSGNIALDVTAAVMDVAVESYYWELEVTLPSGSVEVWLSGKFEVIEGIADNDQVSNDLTQITLVSRSYISFISSPHNSLRASNKALSSSCDSIVNMILIGLNTLVGCSIISLFIVPPRLS